MRAAKSRASRARGAKPARASRELSRGGDHARAHRLADASARRARPATPLTPEQLAALEDEHRRLANAGQLLQGGNGLAERLDGDSEFALTGLAARAHAEATRLAALDPRMTPIVDLLDAAQIQLTEASDTLVALSERARSRSRPPRRSRGADRQAARAVAQASRADGRALRARRRVARRARNAARRRREHREPARAAEATRRRIRNRRARV